MNTQSTNNNRRKISKKHRWRLKPTNRITSILLIFSTRMILLRWKHKAMVSRPYLSLIGVRIMLFYRRVCEKPSIGMSKVRHGVYLQRLHNVEVLFLTCFKCKHFNSLTSHNRYGPMFQNNIICHLNSSKNVILNNIFYIYQPYQQTVT